MNTGKNLRTIPVLKGILWKILNISMYCSSNLVLASLKTGLSAAQEWSIANLLTLLTLFPFIILTRKKHMKMPSGIYLRNYIYRGTIIFFAYITWIQAMREIGINDATALAYIGPILTTILASIINKEPWQLKCIAATTIGLLCALFIFMPEFHGFPKSGIITIAVSIFLYSFYEILCKQQTVANQWEQTFFVLLVTSAVGIPFFLLNFDQITTNISPFTILILWAIGLFRSLNTVVLLLAYKYAPLNILQPFSYLRLAFTAFGTYVLYGRLPTINVLCAVSVIIFVNLCMAAYATKRTLSQVPYAVG